MQIIGILAAIASITISCIGLPMQIRKNYKLKSTQGISLGLIGPALISYSLWTTYGLTKPDYNLVMGQAPGVILSSVIIYQFWLYRKNRA